MRYLGRVTLEGALTVEGDASVPARFELECYALKGGVIQGSGEITATPKAMRVFLGAAKVDFRTSDGHLLTLTLADKKMPPEGASAHVVASGDLPSIRNGSVDWAPAA